MKNINRQNTTLDAFSTGTGTSSQAMHTFRGLGLLERRNDDVLGKNFINQYFLVFLKQILWSDMATGVGGSKGSRWRIRELNSPA